MFIILAIFIIKIIKVILLKKHIRMKILSLDIKTNTPQNTLYTYFYSYFVMFDL